MSSDAPSYGLVDGLELRLNYDGYVWENAVGSRAGAVDNEGSDDSSVGFKLRLRDEEGWLPETALVPHVGLPTGKAPFSRERFDPDYRLAFSHTLSDRLSFGYNLGQAWVSDEDPAGDRDTRHEFMYSAALGIGLTETLGCFVELFGDVPTGSDGGPANSVDGGFACLMTDSLQLDVSCGVGLPEDADDWFIAAGLSVGFP
jgi:hypothetical protein